MAAVLYWRLTALPTSEAGPLPWLPQIPHTIQDHPAWGNYLAKRAQHVADLAGQIRDLGNPSRRSASLGSAGKPPEHRTHRRHSRVAGRPRHRAPKTHGQPEGTNSRLPRTYANNTSTEISPAPSSRTTPTSISRRHRVRHSVTVTTTSSARIKYHRRTVHLRPAASDRNHQGHNSLGRRLCLSNRAADRRFWRY
jgi:hypothetical protein